jgi:hypothetical protein
LQEDREEDIHQLKVTIKSGDGKVTEYTQKKI